MSAVNRIAQAWSSSLPKRATRRPDSKRRVHPPLHQNPGVFMSDLFEHVPTQMVDRARRRLCVSIDDCIAQIGGMKVAEGATGATRQHLRDTLSDREGRLLEVRWPWRIALLSAEPLRAAIASALVEPLGFSIAPIKPLTDAEKLARLEYRVATQFGSAGVALVEGNKR